MPRRLFRGVFDLPAGLPEAPAYEAARLLARTARIVGTDRSPNSATCSIDRSVLMKPFSNSASG